MTDQNSRSPFVLILLLLIGGGSVAGVYVYVKNEQKRYDEFEARQEQRFVESTNGSIPSADDSVDRRPLGKSRVELKLLALRSKIAKEKSASPLGQPLNSQGMTPAEVTKLRELRRTLSRSFAGRYSREQIHLTVPAIKNMLASGRGPVVATSENRGTPAGLSWRVHLLPFIGEQALFKRFHPGEPWDSKHNITLLAEMPMLYRGLYDKDDASVTRLQSVDMADSFSHEGRLRALSDLQDPETDTIALIIVGTKLAVPWTRPADFSTTVQKYESDMKLMPKPTYWVGTFEGAALRIRYDASFGNLLAMMTLAGGEPDALDAMQREQARLFRGNKP